MIEFLSRLRQHSAWRFCFAASNTLWIGAVSLALSGVLGAGGTRAATETPIYSFPFSAQGFPAAGVIRDPPAESAGLVPVGTLFGTTFGLSDPGGGTVFMLAPPATSGGAWTLHVLHAFHGFHPGSRDGYGPAADLIVDAAGNLFGTTEAGSNWPDCIRVVACGTVFELSPPAAIGEEWNYRVLHRFRRALSPVGKLTLDPSGNGVLYGTTFYGGDLTCLKNGVGCGVAFAMTPPGVNGNTASRWVARWLHVFRDDENGAFPAGSLVLDKADPPDLFGTTSDGGALGGGVAFELLPPNSAFNPVLHWTAKPIHSFKLFHGRVAAVPNALIADSKGVLYGTTIEHGSKGFGTAFELLPPSLSTTGAWKKVTLHSFGGAPHDGDYPSGGLLLDPATGKLYGTTDGGGSGIACAAGCGAVFELAPTSDPGVWHETVLTSFKGGLDGELPSGDLNFGADGYLYGTTLEGGRSRDAGGTVFQVTLP